MPFVACALTPQLLSVVGLCVGAALKKLKFNSKVLIDLATCPPNVKQWVTIFCNFKLSVTIHYA